MKKAAEQLRQELLDASDIRLGSSWLHRGGAVVTVTGLAHLALPDQDLFDAELAVIYLHNDSTWVRPASMFRERFEPFPPAEPE